MFHILFVRSTVRLVDFFFGFVVRIAFFDLETAKLPGVLGSERHQELLS